MINDRSKSEKIGTAVVVAVMVVFCFLCLYPFYYMIIYSLSTSSEAYKVTFLPVGLTLENYANVFAKAGFGKATMISVLRTLIGTAATLFCCGFFGYLVTKEKMVGRKWIYRMLVLTMYLDAGLIPTYLVYKSYQLVNSFWVYILPQALTAYNVILIKTFTEQIPPALEESATLDGANTMRCWWSVVVPLSKPIYATIAVFSAVTQWNSWFDSHIYVTQEKLWSLQYVLYRYLTEVQNLAKSMERMHADSAVAATSVTPETVRMTITAVVTIPILFVYPFMQKYFVKGMQLGAVKG